MRRSSADRFLRRVRIHGGEGGAVARALHHKAKRNSSPAVFEIVSSTTDERKLMSNKTSFKRIALALVVALGFGVMNTSSSYAATTVIDETLTLSASSASIGYGETATLTITNTWTSTITGGATTGETQSIFMIPSAGGTASFTAILAVHSTDSANVNGYSTGVLSSTKVNVVQGVGFNSGANPYTNSGTLASGLVESALSRTAGLYTKQAVTVYFYNANPTTTGSTTYTITSRASDGSIQKSAQFTITTTAPSRTAVATTTKLWLNQADITVGGVPSSEADSALVVSAGLAASPTAVGYLYPIMNNASDTKTTLAGTVGRSESVLVTVSGPGTVALASATSTKSKSQLVGLGETLVVYSDGTAGTVTLTGSIAGTNLTQAAKTITFTGKPATITATVDSAVVAYGSTAVRAVSFTVKDSAGNAITGTSPKNDFTPGGFFLTVADTGVVGGTQVGTTLAGYTTCGYVTALAKWTCDLTLNDSGTATVYISDSYTQGSAVVNSSALTISAAGTGYTGTAALDKTTYNIGEKAILTVTSKDSGGRNVANGDSSPWAATVRWATNSATFVAATGSDAAGGTFTDIVSFLNSTSANTFVSGVDTAVVYMPTVAGTYTLHAKPMGGLSTAAEEVILTFTVQDPGQAATLAAAEAATDAAAEAIDAANAATDAANLSAEAADAATVAAEEARDAADAATAAVEELATAVATLMAALKAQVTTLANTVAKIAKKVGVKK
jgi:trimeric autotransporter adhesin